MGHVSVKLSKFSVLYITGRVVEFWCILEGKKSKNLEWEEVKTAAHICWTCLENVNVFLF